MSEHLQDHRIGEPQLCKPGDEAALKHIYYSARAFRAPKDVVVPIGEIAPGYKRVIYDLRIKAGVLEVDLITRTPKTSPTRPDGSQIMEIFCVVCDHIKSEPVFVGGHTGWSYRIFRFTPQKLIVEPLLSAVGAHCGCYPWLDSGASRKVYQLLSEWLKRLDKAI